MENNHPIVGASFVKHLAGQGWSSELVISLPPPPTLNSAANNRAENRGQARKIMEGGRTLFLDQGMEHFCPRSRPGASRNPRLHIHRRIHVQISVRGFSLRSYRLQKAPIPCRGG